MRGRASSRGDARSGPPRKGDSTVPGALRGVRPGSSNPRVRARLDAWVPEGSRSGSIDFGVSRVGGSVPLVVFGSLGLGIRCRVLGAVGRRESSGSRPWSRLGGRRGQVPGACVVLVLRPVGTSFREGKGHRRYGLLVFQRVSNLRGEQNVEVGCSVRMAGIVG